MREGNAVTQPMLRGHRWDTEAKGWHLSERWDRSVGVMRVNPWVEN